MAKSKKIKIQNHELDRDELRAIFYAKMTLDSILKETSFDSIQIVNNEVILSIHKSAIPYTINIPVQELIKLMFD